MEDLVHMVEVHGLLPDNQFILQPGRTTMDSLHFITKFVNNAWRRHEVISALFLDIKAAFPSIVIDHLMHVMRMRGVPPQYTSVVKHIADSRQTVLKFDSYKSVPLDLSRGLNQGCPLSGITFQFYNAGLLKVHRTDNGKDVISFMDDGLMLACGKTLHEMESK